MQPGFILPLSIIWGTINFGVLASWYVMPALERLPRAAALTPLVLIHSFRYVGLAFLIPGVVSPEIAPAFAYLAAYGDLLAALMALLAVTALRFEWTFAISLVWIFNVGGTLELISALFQGLQNVAAGELQAAYFIPAVAVPFLLVTHGMIFRLLLGRKQIGLEASGLGGCAAFHFRDDLFDRRQRIFGFGHGPADHDIIDPGFDGVGRRHHSLLVVVFALERADSRGNDDKAPAAGRANIGHFMG